MLCMMAKHVHGHTHTECPPADTARTGTAAWVVRVAEHVATHTGLQHTGTTAQAAHMIAAACRGPTNFNFIDL